MMQRMISGWQPGYAVACAPRCPTLSCRDTKLNLCSKALAVHMQRCIVLAHILA